MMVSEDIRIFLSRSNDPFINLALEAYLLSCFPLGKGKKWLLLWQNDPCVILGRFQNPCIECNTQILFSDSVPIARRFSGGGTVYHDLGNLCFSFFSSQKDLDKEANLRLVSDALKNLGLNLAQNKRYDLLLEIDGLAYKVSGSAFKYQRGKALHHGTLLVESDLSRLRRYLKVEDSIKKSIFTRALPSVSSQVANLSHARPNLRMDQVIAAIYYRFCPYNSFGNLPLEYIGEQSSPEYLELYEKFSSEAWIYGETPKFHLIKVPYSKENRAIHPTLNVDDIPASLLPQIRQSDVSIRFQGVL